MDLLRRLSSFTPVMLRLSISLLFLWFGINQIFNPLMFFGYLPDFILLSDFAGMVVLLNGIFELVFAVLLLIGFFTRPVALLLSLHLLSIAITLGYNDIAVRDLVLALAAFSIFLQGPDQWCVDAWLKKGKKVNKNK